MIFPKLVIVVALACLLSNCAQLGKDPAPSRVTRRDCLAMAEEYGRIAGRPPRRTCGTEWIPTG